MAWSTVRTMDILVIQCFNALLYASILFLIAGGLSLIYGVMRIVNLAHGTLYAIGAYMAAWLVGKGLAAGLSPVLLLLLLPVGAAMVGVVGAVMEPTLLRPMYRRAEEYQLLVTFGLLLMLEDVIRFVWGGTPLSAAVIMESLGSLRVLGARYPTYNLVIIAIGLVSAVLLWAFVYRTKFGVLLRATSQDMRMASSLGVNVRKVYVQAFALGCAMAGLGGAIIVPGQAAVLGMGTDALILAFIVVVVGGLGSLLGALIGALIVGVMRTVGIMFFPEIELAVLYPIAVLLLCIPYLTNPYQTLILAYGLIMAIAALGFNLLLGYTGLLSFGHSAYFGLGAYAVAFMVKYLQVTSMEAFVIGGVIATLLVTAVFGVICVRYTRIFFAILTMALSQVLWTLAFKFFWVTGGTDGLRIPTPTILNGLLAVPKNKIAFLSFTYYYYVLLVFFVCVVLMWVIVHSPFGQSLQAIRDNETRAAFLGVRVRRARWIAFMISGGFTGVAGIL